MEGSLCRSSAADAGACLSLEIAVTPAVLSHYKKDIEALECIQEGATKIVKDLENKSHEGSLAEGTGIVLSGEEKAAGDLIAL